MRVLIVDDHALMALSTEQEVLRLRPDAEVRSARSIEEAEARLTDWGEPTVILLDLLLEDAEGLSGLIRLKTIAPGASIAIVSGETSPSVIRDAFRQGARAYLTKTMNIDQSRRALREFLDSGSYVPPDLVSQLVELDKAPRLSPRELDVLRALDSGKLVKQLADEKGISENTFKTYYKSAYRKLGVKTRTQALNRAKQLGLIDPRRRE